jgi:putative transposase
MIRNPKLAKSILDAGWGQLMRLAEYKAIRAGSVVVRVPAAYSTQECSYCGTLNKVSLDVRTFECVGCHRLLDRDTNAAQVVLKRGLAIAGLTIAMGGQDMPELKPAETGLCYSGKPKGQARSRRQELYAPKGLEAHGFSRERMSQKVRTKIE